MKKRRKGMETVKVLPVTLDEDNGRVAEAFRDTSIETSSHVNWKMELTRG